MAPIHSSPGTAAGHSRPAPDQIEVLLPIRSLLLQGRRTIADLDPSGRAVFAEPRLLHVPQVLGSCHGTPAQRSLFNRLKQRSFAAWPDTGAHQIPHGAPILMCGGYPALPTEPQSLSSGFLR